MKPKLNKAGKCVRRCWKSFCIVFFCDKYLKRDVAILAFLLFGIGAIWGSHFYFQRKEKETRVSEEIITEPLNEEESIQGEEKDVPKIQAEIDKTGWTPYQNTWYGFSLKYPNNWNDPVVKKAIAGNLWEQTVQFRLRETSDENPFEGFDVKIYSIVKAKELANTDEFPHLKYEELKAESQCAIIEGHLLETGDYPAEEIYIPSNDACFNAALFFTNTRGSYIYNIVPKIKDGAGLAGDPAQEVASHMPEFFAVASEWNLIDIQRPKPVPAAPKINAPMPLSYKAVNGQLVCAKKNDKPSKSNKGKGKHMDMECCLDPDEYPNPHCYYPPGKYGKYL